MEIQILKKALQWLNLGTWFFMALSFESGAVIFNYTTLLTLSDILSGFEKFYETSKWWFESILS